MWFGGKFENTRRCPAVANAVSAVMIPHVINLGQWKVELRLSFAWRGNEMGHVSGVFRLEFETKKKRAVGWKWKWHWLEPELVNAKPELGSWEQNPGAEHKPNHLHFNMNLLFSGGCVHTKQSKGRYRPAEVCSLDNSATFRAPTSPLRPLGAFPLTKWFFDLSCGPLLKHAVGNTRPFVHCSREPVLEHGFETPCSRTFQQSNQIKSKHFEFRKAIVVRLHESDCLACSGLPSRPAGTYKHV